MDQATSNVVRRFLARNFLADDRFRPPKSVVNAVETGKLDSHVLLFWKDVVEKISATPQGWKGSGSYSAAVAYWRSKCAKNGYPLPREYMEGLGGKGSQGRWSVKVGDEIEEWVKQTMTSQGLIGDLVKTAAEVEMEVNHTKRLLDDAQAKVEKHVAGLGKAKTQKGVAQKQKWLDEAMTEVGSFESQLEKSIEQVKALKTTAVKKDETEVYSIEFEKEFQFRLLAASSHLDKKSVLEAVKKAVERFEKGLEVPGPYTGPADEPAWETKTAGITDWVSGFLLKSWNYLKGAFDLFTDWLADVKEDTKSIATLLKEAGASE